MIPAPLSFWKLADAACSRKQGEAYFDNIVSDCIHIIKHFDHVPVKFAYQSANCVAHLLVRATYSLSDLREWENAPPDFIDRVLNSLIISSNASTFYSKINKLKFQLVISHSIREIQRLQNIVGEGVSMLLCYPNMLKYHTTKSSGIRSWSFIGPNLDELSI